MNTEFYESRRGIPPHPTWIINYDPERALHNFTFLKRCCHGRAVDVGIYVSSDCAAIVVANMPLEAIREPHVMAWRSSFRRLSEQEFLTRMNEFAAGHRRYIGEELPLTSVAIGAAELAFAS